MDHDGYHLNEIKKPITVAEFVKGIGKFKNLTEEQIESIQQAADARYALLKKMAQ